MNQQLGKTLGIVQKALDEWDEEVSHMADFYAPTECYGDVNRSKRKQLTELIRSLGYSSARKLADEVEARTSAHYVYFRTSLTSLFN